MRRNIRKAGKKKKNEYQSETSYGIPTTLISSFLYVGNMNPCNILISGTTRLTKLPHLPVLFSISPPELRWKAASDAVLEKKTASYLERAVYNDVWNHASSRLQSRKSTLSDMTAINVTNEWRYDWQSSFVVNLQTLVSETNMRPHSFDLPYYYYYYYQRKWLRWHRIKRLQGHLTISDSVTVQTDISKVPQ